MDTAWISAFSAIMGSLVGAFTSFVTTYANQRSQYRRDFISKQFAQRETLHTEFINEAARLQIEFLDRQMEKASTLMTIYALQNHICLNSSEEVIQQAAAHTIDKIVASYKRSSMAADEIHRAAFCDIEDLLKEFGETCRNELNRLYQAAA
jgi:hypothetical protein